MPTDALLAPSELFPENKYLLLHQRQSTIHFIPPPSHIGKPFAISWPTTTWISLKSHKMQYPSKALPPDVFLVFCVTWDDSDFPSSKNIRSSVLSEALVILSAFAWLQRPRKPQSAEIQLYQQLFNQPPSWMLFVLKQLPLYRYLQSQPLRDPRSCKYRV